ncbi:hypothetical protein NDU88_001520 [Pleurodeles waltl]|uniref:Uncharacterized protein n=1 Tax=Pleurodeles waltl TaxID=8319 RepID=A0AAV7SAP1_PLEWA|nr:hypothetical protein NDU88_001520 [Pleurodeles waltl]
MRPRATLGPTQSPATTNLFSQWRSTSLPSHFLCLGANKVLRGPPAPQINGPRVPPHQGLLIARIQMSDTAAAISCPQPGAQALPLSSTGAPRHIRGAPQPPQSTCSAAHSWAAASPLLRAAKPQSSRAAAWPEPPRAAPAYCRRRHVSRGSALPLGGSTGVLGPPGLPTVPGVQYAPSTTRFHPIGGCKAMSEA